MYLVAFSLRLTVSCSKGFNFINALSKIFPFSASSVTDSLPFAGFYNSLAVFLFLLPSFLLVAAAILGLEAYNYATVP